MKSIRFQFTKFVNLFVNGNFFYYFTFLSAKVKLILENTMEIVGIAKQSKQITLIIKENVDPTHAQLIIMIILSVYAV